MADRYIHGPQAEAAKRLRAAAATFTRRVTTPVSPSPVENVVGVGIGETILEGKQTGVLAVRFLSA